MKKTKKKSVEKKMHGAKVARVMDLGFNMEAKFPKKKFAKRKPTVKK